MEHAAGLLSLGGQTDSNFSGEGSAWKGASALAELNASPPARHDAAIEDKESISGLEEHDYIGLTEVSSFVKYLPEIKPEDDLSLGEADLDLGLGLGLRSASKKAEECDRTPNFLLKQKDVLLKAQTESIVKPAMEVGRYSFPEGVAASQNSWQKTGSMRPPTAEPLNSAIPAVSREYENKVAMFVQDFSEAPPRASVSSFNGGVSKNGVKRGYTEAMVEASRFSVMGGTRIGTTVAGKSGEGEVKALPKHQQGAYTQNWMPPKPSAPSHWPVGLDQSSGHSFTSSKPGAEKPATECALAMKNVLDSSEQEPASAQPPPSKGQVVGWPPIRSYRKQSLAKSTEMYVKVNMDGMTVGRKVDLNAHSSYEGLLLALEEMFQPSSNGGQGTSQSAGMREGHAHDFKQFRLLNGSDFVLTYEDQDGDWMLVGDVPWSMFVNTVRRLRITRGAEATGLAPRRPDKMK